MTQKFLKIGAFTVLGMLALATLTIMWMGGGVYGKIALGFCALSAIITVCWRKRDAIVACVDEFIAKNPFTLGAIAIVILIICILGGSGVYRMYGEGFSAIEPFLYPIGIAVVILTLFCLWRYTDHRRRDRREAISNVRVVNFSTRRHNGTNAQQQ